MTVPKGPRPPRKHHYIPEFYTKRWTVNGELCVFQQHRGIVKPSRKSPGGTGWVYRLYEIEGYPESLAQQIESVFFRSVDNGAHNALELMEKYGSRADWTGHLRSSWSRFLLSLLLRCPEDVWELKDQILSDYYTFGLDEAEAKYAEILTELCPDGLGLERFPRKFSDFLRTLPNCDISFFTFKVFRSLIDNEKIGNVINRMHWEVLHLDARSPNLITSDRPVVRTNGLVSPDSHLAIALGPRRLFLAARNRETALKRLKGNEKQLVLEYNRAVAGAAMKYVFATDDKLAEFVQKHFGKRRPTSLAVQLRAWRAASGATA